MGLVAAGGVMQIVEVFFVFLGLRKNYLFWARPLRPKRLVGGSSSRQIVLYLKKG